MKNSHKEEQLFYRFIESADRAPAEAALFPFFQFMDQSIRKNFHQLKKTTKAEKSLGSFEEFWMELENESKVNLYCNWVILLKKALQLQENMERKFEPESLTIQDQIYIKKTTPLFSKWEKKIGKLTPTHLNIVGKKNKEFELKYYEIRKSKSKEMFTLVLQPVIKAGKVLHCGFSTQTMFDEWFFAITCNINSQRIFYFLSQIKQQRLNPGSRKQSLLKNLQAKMSSASEEPSHQQKQEVSKTQTEIMIEKQMKSIDLDHFSDCQEAEDEIDEKDKSQVRKSVSNKSLSQIAEEVQEKQNPNIFKKLIPQYHSLTNFADTPINSSLLHCDSDYRIYQLPSRGEQEFKLKFFTVLPFPKSLIFQAIGSESMGWNDDIDILTIKTKISSENTVLFYEKNKPQGILYRERDFLFLRHCFSITEFKQKNTFIIDKSIDSIHQPPFMTVVRAEKQLLWGLIEKESGKECILIVQGWIKGGGYMNQIQNKDMTIKYMRKLMNLNGFVKQISFSETNKEGMLFKQTWEVDFNREEDSFVTPREVKTEDDRQSSLSESSKVQRKMSENISNESKQVVDEENEPEKKVDKQQQELAEFMKRTSEENAELINLEKSQVMISEDKLGSQDYIPPAFDKERFVIIPNNYLNIKHQTTPKDKPKKPKLFPHFRGHHLWKGEWDILPTGGLAYVDAEKMKEQKKVLTYIIKRIGKNIFSGKGILNISLPVDIFCVESNIERLAMSFGFFPHYLEKACTFEQPQAQLKYIIGSGIASSLIYLTMEKPFNPILGQTYQCWIDGCPIYFEQMSHHPPVAAFMMKGRGYTVTGNVEAKMDLSINSGTGNNEGIFTVEFDNGNRYYYTTPAGCLTGLTYGDRKLNMVGKSFYWTESGLFLEVNYGPKNKGGFFGGNKGEGDEKLADYIEGTLKQYNPADLKEVAFKRDQNGKNKPMIPKASPNAEAQKSIFKVMGRWNKYVMVGDEKIFDVNETRYYDISEQKNPLPSHSNYREDIVYRRLKNFVTSQDFKEVLEIKQREDRKLRAKFSKIPN